MADAMTLGVASEGTRRSNSRRHPQLLRNEMNSPTWFDGTSFIWPHAGGAANCGEASILGLNDESDELGMPQTRLLRIPFAAHIVPHPRPMRWSQEKV